MPPDGKKKSCVTINLRMMRNNKFQPTSSVIVAFCFLLFSLAVGLATFPLAPSRAAYFSSVGDVNYLPTPTATPTPEPETVIDLPPMPDVLDAYTREPSAEEILDASLGSTDFDCDGVKNNDDNCVLVYNPNQKDTDRDDIGDACDTKPRVKVKANDLDATSAQRAAKIDSRCDTDEDGIFDRKDNCPLVCNPNQRDKDKDKIGDACEAQTGTIKFCRKTEPAATVKR
jgi:hypothetical protein